MSSRHPVTPVEQLLLDTEKELLSLQEFFVTKSVRASQGGQKALARTLERLCAEARHELRNQRNVLGIAGAADDSDVMALARTFGLFADDIQQKFVRYFAENDQTFFPPEIRWALHRLVADADPEIQFEVILHPNESKTLFTRMIRGLERVATTLFSPTIEGEAENQMWVMISYPVVRARDPFYQALILSHEALHVRDEVRSVSRAVASRFDLEPKDADQIVESLSSQAVLPATAMLPPVMLGERVTEEHLRAQVGELWGGLMASWLSETVVDLMAVRSFGPSFLIAFSEHELAGGMMTTHSDTHPCSLLRIQFMLDELIAMGYLASRPREPLLSMKRQLSAIRRMIAGRKSRGSAIQIKAEEYVRDKRDLLADVARNELSEPYDSARFLSDLPTLLDLLGEGVPPGQIRDAESGTLREAGLAAVLNAAFVFRARHLDSFFNLVEAKDDDAKVRARIRLDELLLKAVELNEVSLAWRSAER